MKALSLTPPWPAAILHLGKRIENRTRWHGCNYRGPILLHAAKGIGSRSEFHETVDSILAIRGEEEVPHILGVERGPKGDWVPGSHMLRAGIVGRAVIDGVLRDERDFAAYAANVLEAEDQRKWWFGGFALVLKNVEPLPFVPWPGALGLFNVPDDYATRVR